MSAIKRNMIKWVARFSIATVIQFVKENVNTHENLPTPTNGHQTMTEFKTQHDLPFEVAAWLNEDFMRFRVGTCDGLWRSNGYSYEILAITNNERGNGHLNDVLEWFEHSCKRDGKNLLILEVWNQDFKKHLIEKRGFMRSEGDNLVKILR